ncbi:MAG: hypothetical protein ABIZ51_03825 [Bacteroidia bacterium]
MKKIIRYILLSIVAISIGCIVLGIILAHNFAYKETDCYPRSAPQIMPFFNDSVSNQIIISSLRTDNLNDSFCFFRYKKYGLFLWVIHQYQNACLSQDVDTIQQKYNSEQLVLYSNCPLEDSLFDRIYSKAFLSSDVKLAIRFNECKKINCLHNSVDYQYYHLKASLIYIISTPHTYYDAYISTRSYTDMDFLVKCFRDKVYIIGMYSLYNRDVSNNDLLNILRKNKL